MKRLFSVNWNYTSKQIKHSLFKERPNAITLPIDYLERSTFDSICHQTVFSNKRSDSSVFAAAIEEVLQKHGIYLNFQKDIKEEHLQKGAKHR